MTKRIKKTGNAEMLAIEAEIEGLGKQLGGMTERRRHWLLTEARAIARARTGSYADALALIAGCIRNGHVDLMLLAGLH